MSEGRYGEAPHLVACMDRVEMVEFCHWQYLPVKMADSMKMRLPKNLAPLVPLVKKAVRHEGGACGQYVYLTARRGWATPDNPINRPGWHCDGFGTDDINFVWWDGSGTRFAVQQFLGISTGHIESMRQFEQQVDPKRVATPAAKHLYRLTPYVVHATPEIAPPGEMRSFVKVSISPHRYNLVGNSHNYLFDYDWPMYERSEVRNDPVYGEADYYVPA